MVLLHKFDQEPCFLVLNHFISKQSEVALPLTDLRDQQERIQKVMVWGDVILK